MQPVHLKMQSQRQELEEEVSQMVEFGDPSLDQGNDFYPGAYGIHHSIPFHVHPGRLDLCHTLVRKTGFRTTVSHRTMVHLVSLCEYALSLCLAGDLEYRVADSSVNGLVPEVEIVAGLCRFLECIDPVLYHRGTAEVVGLYHLVYPGNLCQARDLCLGYHHANRLDLFHGSCRLCSHLCSHQSRLDNRSNHSLKLEDPSEHQLRPLDLSEARVGEILERTRGRLALEMFLDLTQMHCGLSLCLKSMDVVSQHHVLSHL
jgi:hypothetical protein